MNIEDSSPERKNLIICSLGFILFFYGDAEIIDQTIKLPILNVEFNNMGFLCFFVWGALFWFLYRYTLTNKLDFIRKIKHEFLLCRSDPRLIEYLKDQIQTKHGPINNLQTQSLLWSSLNIVVPVSFTKLNPNRQRNERIHLFDTMEGTLIGTRLTIYSLISNETLSQAIVPYFLAIAAITSPIFSQ